MQTTPGNDEGKRSVLDRAFDLLACFSPETPEHSIAELVAMTGLPPATVHRLLSQLVTWEAIERTARGRYRLGMRIWQLGRAVRPMGVMRDVCRPLMVELFAVTRGCVAMGSIEGAHIFLADVICDRSGGHAARIGRRKPLVSSAPGLAWLAHSPIELAIDEFTTASPLRHLTTDKELEIRRRLSVIRRAGFAAVRSTGGSSHSWVAAPVFAPDHSLRATLSIAMPNARFNEHELGGVVARAGKAMTAALRLHEETLDAAV